MTPSARFNSLFLWGFLLLLTLVIIGSWISGTRQRPVITNKPVLPVKTGDGHLDFPHLAWINFSTEQVNSKTSPIFLSADTVQISGAVNLKDTEIRGKLSGRWWWNGKEMPRIKVPKIDNSVIIPLQRPKKQVFGPGIGELELLDGRHRIAYGSFMTTDQPNAIISQIAPPTGRTQVTQLFTAAAAENKEAPGAKRAEFKPQDRIYAVFQYQLAEPKSSFVVHWGIDGREIDTAQRIVTVERKDGVGWAWIQAGGSKKLPPATYEVWITYTTNPDKLAFTTFNVK